MMRIEPPARVLLIGGSGFIGRVIARQLADEGYRVTVLTRRSRLAGPLSVLPGVELKTVDSLDAEGLALHMQGIDAVVNLVGILHESRRKTFQAVHVDHVRRVIEACHLAGVSRIIHLSAVGASPSAPSRYLRSKAEAEALLVASGLEVTILSPSVVFGPEDNFVNLFAGLIKWMPVVPLACAHAEFQPVYVEDVARAVVLSLQRAETIGQNLPLGGPEVVRLGDLIKRIGGWMGRSPSVVPLPLPLSFLQAALMELMPVPLMTRDNVRSMLVPSVAGPIPAVLGFEPQSMALIVPNYVAVPVDAFSALRRQAAR